MPIEKAFAIRAKPHEIYRAIEADIAEAREHEGSTFEVLHRDPGRSVRLRVLIGAIPCTLEYTIIPREDHCEVVGTLDPYGWKYVAFRLMTFGLSNGGFDAALVQALVNLKEAVEAEGEAFPDEEDRLVAAPDE